MGSLNIGEEKPIENEEFYSQKIADRFKQILTKSYKPGSTKRMFHPKMHGLVSAEFIIERDLPEHLKKGIFSTEKTYSSWVRFSNAKRNSTADKKKDMRGMAIKLIGVSGKKLIANENDATTQDFVLVTAETLQTASVKDFQKAIYALTGGFFRLFIYALTHLKVIKRSIRQISKCSNIFEKKYFSMTPYQFGEGNAVKYCVVPKRQSKSRMPGKPVYNYLRNRLFEDLTWEDQYFDFMVQFQTDASKMPIEDPTVKWSSPFEKVATIKIAKQKFNSDEQWAYGENLSFTPWHSIEEHRPLGGVNRARKLVYEQLALFRRERNNVQDLGEPDNMIIFN